MEQQTKVTSSDFSTLFNEIEKFHSENPLFYKNIISREDLDDEETIRAFTEICEELKSFNSVPVQYLTFS